MTDYQLSTFDNGLRVASEVLPGMESVTVCVSLNVGARQETESQHGMAHLLEHMAFKGTARRSARDIAEEFDAIGGHINAYTSMEQTVYYARVLAEHLPVAMDILGDILQHSTFDAKELKREQEVIVQEIAMHHDTPEDMVFDHLHEVVYPEHPLGRTILGTPESVRGFQPDDIRHYVNSHYHAPAMVISAAGKVSHQDLVKLTGEHFSHIGQGEIATKSAPNYFAGEHRHDKRELEQLQLMLAFEGVSLQDDDHYSMQLLSTIFGGGMSSRLFQEVRENRGLVYSVQSFMTSYSDAGFFGIYAATSEDRSPELLAVLADESRKLLDGVTEKEIDRAKNQQKASILMRRESPTGVAETIARHLQEYDEYRNADVLCSKVDEITRDDLQRVAERLFAKPKLALAALGPQQGLEGFAQFEQRFAA